MTCDMCGADASTRKYRVEGVEMNLCKGCSTYGTPILPSKVAKVFKRRKVEKEEEFEFIVPNAGSLVKSAREKRGMKQIDLSRMLNIKESTIHKVESGELKPTLAVAKQFEEGLGLKLIAKRKEKDLHGGATSSGESTGFTIADFMKKK